jgi:hypothetical protein
VFLHKLVLRVGFVAACLAGACTGSGNGTGDDGGGDDDPIFAEDHPRIYINANRDRLSAALTAQTPAAARFKDMVDRWVDGGDVYGFEPWYAALVGQLTGDARYCTAAIAATDDFVLAERDTISGGGVPEAAHDSYLEVGPFIGSAMLVYDWCFDTVTTEQRERWLAYAQDAVWNVWHPDDAIWNGENVPWSGWSIDNPSNNYYYSFLRATMLLGLAAHGEVATAQEWLTMFRNTKIEQQLVPTFERDLTGGGSREGTGYGVAMKNLWELYDLWTSSTGENIADLTGHTRASLLHFIHETVPTRDRIAPVGDHARDSTATLFDYHRQYVQELAFLYPDDDLAPRARWFIDNSSVPVHSSQFMFVYDFLYDGGDDMQPLDGMGRAYYASGIGQIYNRSSWATDATWMNMITGPYTESHAHQDQGSFLIYKGEWLAYDPNIHGHSGLHQEVDAHNLVAVLDGGAAVPQRTGTESELVALRRGDGWFYTASDLTDAYAGNGAIDKVQREMIHLEPDAFVVFDRVDTSGSSQQRWQLSSPVSPSINGARATFQGSSHSLTVERVLPAGASGSVVSWPSVDGDYNGGFRYQETVAGGQVRHLHVIWADGDVGTVEPSDSGGRQGVIVHFADGRTATVRFGAEAGDATVELRNAGGSVTDSADLSPGLDELPE